jgi:hypothetical protein
MQEGIVAHEAKKKRAAEEAARLKVLTLETCRRELAKLGVPSDDLLMQARPGPSCQEMRQIQREFSAKPKKQKLGETKALVSDLQTSDLGATDLECF